MQNLAAYWNSESKLFSDLNDKQEILKAMNETISNKNHRPDGYKYS